MKKTLFFFAAIATIVASCAKQEIEETVSPEPTAKPSNQITIIASVDQTKTTMDGSGNFSWQASEQIGVAEDGETDVYPFVLANAAVGTFTGTKDGDLKYAVSPKSFLTSVAADGVSYTITLPDTYSGYVSGTTNDIMIAGAPEQVGDDYKFTFKHAASLVKFTYENVPVGTSGFRFTADVNITGSFELTSASNVTLTTPGTGGKTVTIMLASAVTELNQNLEFYVPVPVGTIGSFRAVLLTGSGDNTNEIAGTLKKKTVDIELKRCDVFVAPTITLSNTIDILTYGFIGLAADGTNYTAWSNKTSTSGVVYAGSTAKNQAKVVHRYIQLTNRTTSPYAGIVTTSSNRLAKKVCVTWATEETTADDRTITVYGKNTAYESAADLYNDSKKGTEIGTIVKGTNDKLTISTDYKYIALKAGSALYCDEIDITWGDAPHGVSATPSPLLLGGVSGSSNTITVDCGYAWETAKTEGSDNFNVSIDGKVITVTSLQNGGASEAKIGTLRIKESADASYYVDVEIRQSAAPAHGVTAADSATLGKDKDDTQTVTVACNYNWEVVVTEGDDKISVEKTNATTVTVTAKANGPASEGKVGTIRIRETANPSTYYKDVTINQKAYVTTKTVTFTVSSTSDVTVDGDKTGISAVFSTDGALSSGTIQMTAGKGLVLTISGMSGKTITDASVDMKSNSSKGQGSLSLKTDGDTIASIADSKFNTSNWYGAWSTTVVTVPLSVTETTVGTSKDVVLSIDCTSQNSLYFQKLTLKYHD